MFTDVALSDTEPFRFVVTPETSTIAPQVNSSHGTDDTTSTPRWFGWSSGATTKRFGSSPDMNVTIPRTDTTPPVAATSDGKASTSLGQIYSFPPTEAKAASTTARIMGKGLMPVLYHLFPRL